MKKYYSYLILLLVLLGVAGAFIYFGRGVARDLSHSPLPTQALKTTLSVDAKSFDISHFVGKSALEATQGNATVVTSGSGENAFVTSINGRAADSKKHEFWELVINGVSAQVGAGSYIIKNGDSILWKISTY